MSESEQKVSKYSSGEHVLLRIHKLWDKLHESVLTHEYIKWNLTLDRIFCELINLMDNDEEVKYFKDISIVDEEIKKTGRIIDDINKEKGFEKLTKEDFNKRASQYDLLTKKEKKIREIQRNVETKVDKKTKESWD